MASARSPGLTALTWLAGVALVIVMLEYAPRLGGAVLLVLVVYLALHLPQKVGGT